MSLEYPPPRFLSKHTHTGGSVSERQGPRRHGSSMAKTGTSWAATAANSSQKANVRSPEGKGWGFGNINVLTLLHIKEITTRTYRRAQGTALCVL